jgi:glycosyltransferase involved in cell wall biosynthesis
MTTPLVSVILPTRNRVDFLRGAVASVLRQSERDLELIVVDDASSDETQAYLAALLAEDARVRIVRNAVPKGGAGARNEGVMLSRGKWIAFLDDDDEWMPNKLRKQLETLNANSSAVACSCAYFRRFPSGRSVAVAVPSNASLEDMLIENRLGGASLCVCSSTVLKSIGGFDQRLRSAQDHDLWMRLIQAGAVVVCDELLVIYRAHAGPRVTNDQQSQYAGARRFYFKYRHLMNETARRRRISHNCFLMSRQMARGSGHRVRYLLLSMLNARPWASLRYARSSIPRLAKDALLNSLRFWTSRAR